MIDPKFFYDELTKNGTDFFAGVPDSLLKNFCAYITDTAPEDAHIIAANEGSAIGLAAGYHLATGKVPLVYMQNSGLGNTVNPLLSLVDPDVYKIPLIMVVGWRGEPGVKDEPQHVKQGKVTIDLLQAMGVEHCVLSIDEAEAKKQIEECYEYIGKTGAPFAFVIQKDTFADYKLQKSVKVIAPMSREKAIETIVNYSDAQDIFVSTTGMTSRELYEMRNAKEQGHEKDFLTVGSMGHASQIALSIALQKKERRVFCIDGDGAFIMHMGGLSAIGTRNPKNFVHIVLNNGAHDSVGGQPTVGLQLDIPAIALACGYKKAVRVESEAELVAVLDNLAGGAGGSTSDSTSNCSTPRDYGPILIEVAVSKGARSNLGRPKESPQENKAVFMEFIK